MILAYCVMGVWGGIAAYLSLDYRNKLLAVANALAASYFFVQGYTMPL